MAEATDLLGALADQPRAHAALSSELAGEPSHAYLFAGPAGSGKRQAARAFAAELLAAGSRDPEDARRRAVMDPSPHPDLVWMAPPGNQHLVAAIREQVIVGASYSPFESARRVFVIEAADSMGDESQNGLLKTLEEPPPYAHLILISSAPAELLDTVKSRCRTIEFAPLSAAAIAERLAAEMPGRDPVNLTSLARLACGDLERARFLAVEAGERLRAVSERVARAPVSAAGGEQPWTELLAVANEEGDAAAAAVEAGARDLAEELGEGREADRVIRDGAEQAKRAARRRRTEVIDLALSLVGLWHRDLLATLSDAPDTAANRDRAQQLASDAAAVEAVEVRRVVELVQDARRRLEVNVSEELALEALVYRAEALLNR